MQYTQFIGGVESSYNTHIPLNGIKTASSMLNLVFNTFNPIQAQCLLVTITVACIPQYKVKSAVVSKTNVKTFLEASSLALTALRGGGGREKYQPA